MTRWLEPDEQHAWRGLLAMNARLMSRLNRELQETSGLSLADYDILVALTDTDAPSLRIGELGVSLEWEKSRLSKQLSRMEARGLVIRRDCEEDRRGIHVALTDEGRAAIERAAPAHVAVVRELVFDGLTEPQLRTLDAITTAVLQRLDAADDA